MLLLKYLITWQKFALPPDFEPSITSIFNFSVIGKIESELRYFLKRKSGVSSEKIMRLGETD